jgi:DNA polymerase I-like protein with 3'-5' exonuclease and polymerase domains
VGFYSFKGDVMTPEQALPIIMDRRRSPVVALDTEFKGEGIGPAKAQLTGLSLAGGNPSDGLVACFWPFGPNERTSFIWLKDNALVPLFNDPERTIVEHPTKVDMQVLRARGIATIVEQIRAKIRCTMAQLHIFDENLPKGLKECAEYLLGVTDTASHSEMQRELAAIRKAAEKEVKALAKEMWERYHAAHRKRDPVQFRADPFDAKEWEKIAAGLPDKLKKAEVEAYVLPALREQLVVEAEKRVAARFALYGAKDALYTLGLDYFLQNELKAYPQRFHDYIDLETYINFPVVTEMEETGLKIDVRLLQSIHDVMAKVIEQLRGEVLKLWGTKAEDAKADDDTGEFNPASTPQVCRIVWDEWKLRPPPWALSHGELRPKWRRSDGYCKVNDEVLEYLEDHGTNKHAVTAIGKLRELRGYEKLQGTYVINILQRALADAFHRVRASFWAQGAATGRWTSDDPNFQNIPRPHTMPEVPVEIVRWFAQVQGIDPAAIEKTPPLGIITDKEKGKDGKEKLIYRVASLREVFIAEDDYLLVSADLSQIENRIIAHESQDPRMLWLYRTWDCFVCKGTGETNKPLHVCPKCGAKEGKRNKSHPDQPVTEGFVLGRDIHALTAVMVGLVTKHGAKEGRQRAKTVNHAKTYGMSVQTMARRDKMDNKEAQGYSDAWDKTYQGVKPLHARVQRDIREKGIVTMFDGHVRRFYVDRLLLKSDNFDSWEWEGTIREGTNCLAQGGTAIIVKKAMRIIRDKIASTPHWRGRVRIISQVHDEILLEVHKDIADEVLAFVIETLENVVELSVPIIAEGGKARTWGRAHA